MCSQSWLRISCLKCKSSTDSSAQAVESLCDGIEAVNSFLYLRSKVASSGDCKAAVTARMISGWAKFKECRDIYYLKIFLSKSKNEFMQAVLGQQCYLGVSFGV